MSCKDTFRVVGEDGQDYEVDGDVIAPEPLELAPRGVRQPSRDSDIELIRANVEALDTSEMAASDIDIVQRAKDVVIDQYSRYKGEKSGDLFPGAGGFHRRSYDQNRLGAALSVINKRVFAFAAGTTRTQDLLRAVERVQIDVQFDQAGIPEPNSRDEPYNQAQFSSTTINVVNGYLELDFFIWQNDDASPGTGTNISRNGLQLRLTKEHCQAIIDHANS